MSTSLRLSENYSEYIQHPLFRSIGSAAASMDQPAYVIGGWVRDLLLDRPSKDVDIVTVGSGIALAEAVQERVQGASEVKQFKNFGTAMMRLDDWEVEFVGARKESYQRHSRNPIVEEGTLEEDQQRRDFTINALSISLNEEDFGTLYDPFSGIDDLAAGILRTPLDPEITFSDDPLRMMRAIRFANQLGFSVHEAAFEAICTQADRLDIVAPERIAEELHKIMRTPKPSVGLKLLDDATLLERFLPEVTALKGVQEVEGQRHKENFYHTLQVVDNISEHTDNLWLRYAALFHDIGKAVTKKFVPDTGWTFHSHEFVGSKMVPAIFKRLRLPRDQPMRYVKQLVSLSSRPISLASEEATDSGVRRLLFEAGEYVEDLMTLCEADITTRSEARKRKYLNNFQRVREKLREVEAKDHVRNFQPPVKGDEIIKAFQLRPGKEIGILKNAIKEAILDGEIPNEREAAWEFLRAKAREMGLLSD